MTKEEIEFELGRIKAAVDACGEGPLDVESGYLHTILTQLLELMEENEKMWSGLCRVGKQVEALGRQVGVG